MGKSHSGYEWKTHTEKDSGKQHYWKEAYRKAKEKMGECSGNRQWRGYRS